MRTLTESHSSKRHTGTQTCTHRHTAGHTHTHGQSFHQERKHRRTKANSRLNCRVPKGTAAAPCAQKGTNAGSGRNGAQ